MKEDIYFVYLSHVLSKDGGNMPNIIHKEKKSTGTQIQIANILEPLERVNLFVT